MQQLDVTNFRRTYVAALVTLFVATALPAAETKKDYQKIPDNVVTFIEKAEKVFVDQDAEGVRDYLTEDFTWYRVTEQGAEETVKGRDETVALLSQFFGQNNWVDSDVHRLGMLGNILVQVEVDTFQTEDGPKTVESLSVYEFRDGKRWREWKFYPSSDQPF